MARRGPAPRAERAAQQIRLAERRKKALEMRTMGIPPDVIAERLGYYDRSHMYRDVGEALRDIPKASANEMRALMIEKLSRYEMFATAQLDAKADPKVTLNRIKVGIRLIDTMAELLGLKVQKIELGGDVSLHGVDVQKLTDAQLEELRHGRLPPSNNGEERDDDSGADVLNGTGPRIGGSGGAGVPPPGTPAH